MKKVKKIMISFSLFIIGAISKVFATLIQPKEIFIEVKYGVAEPERNKSRKNSNSSITIYYRYICYI